METETISEISSIRVGDEDKVYVGLPIESMFMTVGKDRAQGNWGGYTNFKLYNTDTPQMAYRNVEHAFQKMCEVISNEKEAYKYQHGYVADFWTRTVYYDNESVLEFLKERGNNMYEFFVNFILIDCWCNTDKIIPA